ncbi:MAG TPA: hypothetical protein VFU81_16405 [Thermomicrobiales bacterium]|nr:hypothetical protein [Thermomicrobiales bacterium]
MTSTMTHRLVILAAALSVIAAIIHLIVMPEHFGEWWGYGAFFLLAATAQAVYAVLLLRGRPSWLLLAGIVGNLAIVALWAWTRTVGIPIFGPHAGEVEEIGAIDVVSKVVEALLIAVLAVLLRDDQSIPDRITAARRRYA